MKFSPVARLLKLCLYVIFVLIVVLLFTTPYLLEAYMRVLFDIQSVNPDYKCFMVPFLLVLGVLALWITGELIVILHSVPRDPFVPRNVRALSRMGAAGLLGTGLFVYKCFYMITPLTLGSVVILLLCAMVAFTLADLFRQAVAYKQENDLTI